MSNVSPYGFNLGNVLAQAEDITAARTRNQLASLQLDDELRARELRGAAVGGDRGALNDLAIMDPGRAGEVISYIQTLDETERANLTQNTEDIGRLAYYVLSSDDPEAAYQQVLGAVPEETRAAMPSVYDEQWAKLQLAQAQTLSELMSQSTGTRATAQTAIGKAAQDLEARLITQEQYDTIVGAEMKKILDEEAPEGLENAVTNSIRATVATMFGGVYNPLTGEFGGMDPSVVNQAVDLMAAAELIAAEQGIPAARAVQMARDTVMGTPTPGGAPAPANNDPLGIR